MSKKEILNAICNLARSQGFYGRVLAAIDANPDYLDFLESQKFGDILDMVFFLERD